MNIGVYTQYNSAFKPIADITVPVLSEYCSKHGYHLSAMSNQPVKRSIIWDRVLCLLENMEKHDWVVHMDTDVLVTDLEVKLEDLIHPKCHLMLSADQNGINDGILFVRNSPEARMILSTVWQDFGRTGVHCAQDALRDLIASSEVVRTMVYVAPQARFNSYLYTEYGMGEDTPGHWRKGDFILHLPGRSNERRVELLNQVLLELSNGS